MNNLPQYLKYAVLLCLSLLYSVNSHAAAISYPLNLNNGWNLLGNSLSTPIDVKATFGAQTNVTTAWKWNATSSTWAFYAPSLDNNGTLATYAASKGYKVLSTIDPGEGYWVNATAASTMGNQAGSSFALNAANLSAGWNLSATGDEVTPAAFSNTAGNVTTLWAWDNANSNWHFHAPSLAANNTLAGYITSKGYKDFGALTLGSGRGFWVNSAGLINVAPVANAGVSQNVVAGSTVTLNGAASSDANGDALTYVWTLTAKPAGSAAALTNATAVAPTFVADKAGSYVATLVVNDGKLNSTASTITVTAGVANVAPVANAGAAQNVVAGSTVTLNGAASSDANGDALTYAWTLTSKPADSSATLASATTAAPTFTADVAGTYVVTLVVNDGKVSSAPATVTVTAAVAPATTYSATSGVAQKGPLQINSTVTAQELDKNLSPTGKQYTYQIESDLGEFNPTSKFTSNFIGLNANGYYFDEVTGAVSTGPLTLNGVADLKTDTVLNVNLLTTLAYRRIINLVTNNGMTVAAARTQAEGEVLAFFRIPNVSTYGNFGSLDISKRRDGDNFLAAISSLFVQGNTAGNLSALIAAFQTDLANNGIIDTIATKTALATSAQTLNAATVATNLTSKYTSLGIVYAATDISNWIDQDGDGVIGKYKFKVFNAVPTSTYSVPSYVVVMLDGASISISTGTLKVNGAAATGSVTIKKGDSVSVSPPAGTFPAGVLAAYLLNGSTKVAKVSFMSGLQSIAVTPANSSTPNGLTKSLTATATFTDGSTQVLTSASWSSNNTSVATVDASGIAKGVLQGVATITATFGTITGNTTLTITPAVLTSIVVSNPSIANGLTQQLTATGVYSDGTTAAITSTVTWLSASPSVATVSAIGVAKGISLGTASITATSGTITGSANVNITSAVLQSIAVTPSLPTVAKGLTQQLTATGTYSDASTQTLTGLTWTSATTSVATVSGTGLVSTLTQGTSVISATSGLISGNTTLTVGPAVLRSIAITPANTIIAKDVTQQFVATGTFTDSSTANISSNSTWSSNTTAVVTISSTGLATGLTTGSATIDAASGGIMGSTSLTVRPPGTVVAWGDNGAGQTTIPAGLSGVTAIAAGSYHTVALKHDGTVVTWGDYGSGQTAIPAGLSGVTAIAAGNTFTVALKNDGTVLAWGYNLYGPTTIPAGLNGVTAIAAGYYHTVALKNDGTVVAWGGNSSGQTTIPSGLSGVTAIAAGYLHTVALKNDGTVVAWGDNIYGATTVPTGLSGVTAIAAGTRHTVALKNDGTVVAWGWNAFGQTTIPAGLSGVTAIAPGGSHTVVLKNDGTVLAWGDNRVGQTTIPAGLSGVTAIAAGSNYTVVIIP